MVHRGLYSIIVEGGSHLSMNFEIPLNAFFDYLARHIITTRVGFDSHLQS